MLFSSKLGLPDSNPGGCTDDWRMPGPDILNRLARKSLKLGRVRRRQLGLVQLGRPWLQLGGLMQLGRRRQCTRRNPPPAGVGSEHHALPCAL